MVFLDQEKPIVTCTYGTCEGWAVREILKSPRAGVGAFYHANSLSATGRALHALKGFLESAFML